MTRTPLLTALRRSLRLARDCEELKISTREGIERRAEAEHRYSIDRRRFLEQLGAAAILAGGLETTAYAARPPSSPGTVAIVGAGIAGLACADALKQAGVIADVYEAGSRAGGRCWSLRSFFPGQTAERGGEFIDNLHKTMIRYARRFNLALEDVTRQPGEVFYYFNGQHHAEDVVVDEYRDFVDAMHGELQLLSSEITADSHTPHDVAVDNISLLDFLEGQNTAGEVAGPVLKAAIVASYEAEYGLSAAVQSSLNFLHFIHADKRSKFTPFGVYSDERWHVTSGNDGITTGLANAIAGQITYGHRLTRVRRNSAGRYELTFARDTGGSVTRTVDRAVITLPFSVLRGVQLDASLGLSAGKQIAIAELGYGNNAKMMLGFGSRPWQTLGGNGASYSDLAHHQTTWETNPTNATATRAILTDYSSGTRGAALDPQQVTGEANDFLADLDVVYAGASAAATRINNAPLAHLEHWPSNPRTLGSYTCYTLGQFTRIGGNEGKREGNLFFAGEHTDSFYSWQGFMEGAALSGLRAADEVLAP
jgi:monoamine oxidase